jgi:ATP-dependent protease HslVU (ClpYQ) peptidase subunit
MINVNAMTERSITVEKSIKALSDDKTLVLFETIAHQELDPHNVLTKLGLTKRQYYSRMFSMLAAGLIRRKNGMYSVTSFGKVVYKAQTLIGKGVSNHWKLSAVDSLEMNSTALVQEEFNRLMNLLIDNEEIREILVQHSNNKYSDKTIAAAAAVSSSKIEMRVLQRQ